jgi:SMODS-associated and fused to various effectors sensor domain
MRRRGTAAQSGQARGSDVTRPRTRDIKPAVQNLLWGRAAGCCQLDNCNRDLTRVPATQATRNLAEKAHIYAFSRGGPRADDTWTAELLNDVENLLLVCHDCHVLIDRGDGPDRYTAVVLMETKRRHEQRIRIATAIAPNLSSHVLTYGTFVGAHQALPSFDDAAAALFPARLPASATVIELGTRTGSQRDRDDTFWAEQRRELAYQFERQVRTPIERGDISHLSIFALAPQPLLTQLGVLIGDITPADTFQRHREPPGWDWPAEAPPVSFEVSGPAHLGGSPALVLAVSATITPDRITRVLGNDAAVWTITVPEPHNDLLKAREMLSTFRQEVRKALDRIKAQHGHTRPIHVFPALPVSLAVELGRVRMPKADAPWILYDEQQSRGGFLRAFTLTTETDP